MKFRTYKATNEEFRWTLLAAIQEGVATATIEDATQAQTSRW